MEKRTHRLIARVTDDFERWSYNTTVAALMQFVNELYRYVQSEDGACRGTLDFAVDTLLKLLAPMAPHITAELWEVRHGQGATVHDQSWPKADPALVKVDQVTMVIQVNGKLRDRFQVSADIGDDEATRLALGSARVREHLHGAEPKKVVVRPPRLVNVVV